MQRTVNAFRAARCAAVCQTLCSRGLYLSTAVLVASSSPGAAGCGGAAEPDENVPPPPEGTPRQFMLLEDPRVVLVDARIPQPDSDVVVFAVTTVDSTPHRGWWPTRLHVESDRGFDDELLLAPYACLDSITSGPRARLDWPFNFEWWACDGVGINNEILLTMEQIRQAEVVLPGRLLWFRPFLTMPGGSYDFRVSVGRRAIDQAIANVEALSFIRGDVYHPTNDPICVISDVVPPPPCPPWNLVRREYFTFGDTPGDSIPVSRGGWIRATYIQSDSMRRVDVLEFQ